MIIDQQPHQLGYRYCRMRVIQLHRPFIVKRRRRSAE